MPVALPPHPPAIHQPVQTPQQQSNGIANFKTANQYRINKLPDLGGFFPITYVRGVIPPRFLNQRQKRIIARRNGTYKK